MEVLATCLQNSFDNLLSLSYKNYVSTTFIKFGTPVHQITLKRYLCLSGQWFELWPLKSRLVDSNTGSLRCVFRMSCEKIHLSYTVVIKSRTKPCKFSNEIIIKWVKFPTRIRLAWELRSKSSVCVLRGVLSNGTSIGWYDVQWWWRLLLS